MPTKLQDWSCDNCHHTWEYLSHGEEDTPVFCPECESPKIQTKIATPLVTTCHDPEVLKKTLKQRSAEHTAKLVRSKAGHRGTLPPNFGRGKHR